jgi:hypothetical protein
LMRWRAMETLSFVTSLISFAVYMVCGREQGLVYSFLCLVQTSQVRKGCWRLRLCLSSETCKLLWSLLSWIPSSVFSIQTYAATVEAALQLFCPTEPLCHLFGCTLMPDEFNHSTCRCEKCIHSNYFPQMPLGF